MAIALQEECLIAVFTVLCDYLGVFSHSRCLYIDPERKIDVNSQQQQYIAMHIILSLVTTYGLQVSPLLDTELRTALVTGKTMCGWVKVQCMGDAHTLSV